MILITDRKISKIDDISVANDKEVIRLDFKCKNQVTELLKLTDCTEIYINYQNGSTKDRYIVTDLTTDGEWVSFSWLLGQNATKKQGTTYFVVCAQVSDRETISQEWNSLLASFKVYKGLETVTAETEPLEDIFSQLIEMIDGKQDKGDYATETELTVEASARQNADNNLQGQIDTLAVASDVVDVVGTYADLVNYDTTHIKANDIIKVLTDSTHSNALSYYRWVITGGVGAWVYVGSEGPFYTKAESDVLLQAKLNTNQGSSNVGKVMTVGADGILFPKTARFNLPLTPLALSNTATALSSLNDGTYIVTNEGIVSTTAGGSISFVEGAIIAVQSDSGAKYASVINGLYAGYLADQSDTEIELYAISNDLKNFVTQSDMTTALNLKANKATTYTKTQVNTLLDGKVSSSSASTIWTGTQNEYDAITTKDSDTLYFIVEASS